MNRFHKAFLFTGLLLGAASTSTNLHAQDRLGPLTTVPDNLTIIASPDDTFLVYNGAVTQTTAAGQTTTGTFQSTVLGSGRVAVTVTLNGVSTNYVGKLRHKAGQPRFGNGAGYVSQADAEGHRLPGAAKVPLIVDHWVIQGGTLDATGTGLVFRGTTNTIQPVTLSAAGGQ